MMLIQHTKEGWSSAVIPHKSSDDAIAIVDTGTSVDIYNEDPDLLHEFNSGDTINIKGFNGSTSRTMGSGKIIGMMKTIEPRSIPLTIPRAQVVPGAPHKLISVSNLVNVGYRFLFAKDGSYLITQQWDFVPLERLRNGLWTLTWTQELPPEREVKAKHSRRHSGYDILGPKEMKRRTQRQT